MTKKVRPLPALSYTRTYARNLLSKFWYNWVFLRRGIEIVPLDSLTMTDTEMAPWKFLHLKWHRLSIAVSTVPPSVDPRILPSAGPTLLHSADPTLFFISTPYSLTTSSPRYSYQKERSSISTPCCFSISTPSSLFVSSPYCLPLAGLTFSTYSCPTCPLSEEQGPLFLHLQVSFLFN